MNPSPRTCTGGHVYTVSWETPLHKPCIWSRIFKVSRVPDLLDPTFGVNVHSIHGDPPRPWTLGHISTVSIGDTPLQTLYLWSHVHSVQTDPTPHRLNN